MLIVGSDRHLRMQKYVGVQIKEMQLVHVGECWNITKISFSLSFQC